MSRRRSNTVGYNLKNEHYEQDKINHSSLLSQSRKIQVIMRRTSKLARIVEIPTVLTLKQLFEIIEQQFYIPPVKLIIFIKNKRYDFIRQILPQILIFKQKDIIHVHNRQIVQRDLTCIYLQFLNSQLIQYKQIKIETTSKQIILNAFQDSLMYQIDDISKFIFSQSSRYINIIHSFIRQAIEDDSIILAIPKQRGKQISLSKLQSLEIQILQSRMKLTKKTSLHLITSQKQKHNFKKKFQYHIYKSMILPGSRQVIWKQDNTNQISKQTLIKKLTKKRKKIQQIEQIKQQDLNDEYYLPTQQNNFYNKNHQFHYQNNQQQLLPIKKISSLQSSQNFHKLYDIKNLKPPSIGHDILQQIEDNDLKYYQLQNKQYNHDIVNGDIIKNNINSLKSKYINIQQPIHYLNTHLQFQDDSNQIMEI